MPEPTQEELDDSLAEELDTYQHDPLGFAENMFPWGEAGTSLASEQLEDWQIGVLKKIGDKLQSGLVKEGDAWKYVGEVIQEAVASGNGIGKSALIAILILWALSTFEDAQGVVTANTQTQLKTKTWPRLSTWYNLFLAKHLFVYTATAIYSADPDHQATWRVDAIPWSKTSPESFAGLHNKGKRVFVAFDESSAIPDIIWDTTDGAFTDANTEMLWIVFGNPTRNTGRFKDCFMKLAHRWGHLQVDSRKVRITDKKKINQWIEDYGEDSDYVRVHVRGVFPRIGDRQFISPDLAEEARVRGLSMHPKSQDAMPKIITLDSAWTGVDEIVCGARHGNNFKVLWVQSKNDDDVALARRLAQTEDEEKADAVFIDFAYGTGCYSVGKHMNRKWQLIQFGGGALDPKKYKNKRAEMYGLGRQWLKDGGALQDDPRLIEEICSAEEIFRDDGLIQLEAKVDIKERLGFSPGRADAWALSFAMPVKMKSPEERELLAQGLAIRQERKQEFSSPRPYDYTADLDR